jgi:hypothetical protein
MMHLIQKQNGCPVLGARLRFRPAPFPESGKCSIRLVPGSIDRCIAEPFGNLEKECGFAHLPRPCQELNSTGRRFAEPL